jgi:hypothetical protein
MGESALYGSMVSGDYVALLMQEKTRAGEPIEAVEKGEVSLTL